MEIDFLDSLPSFGTTGPQPAAAPAAATAAPATRKQKAKRKKHVEFDGNGEWSDVRRFDRMPITTDAAAELEGVSGNPPGAYFISVARKRMQGMINLHDRWLKKIKNKKSAYSAVQTDLCAFYKEMLVQFDARYSDFVTHPLLDAIGVTRKRATNTTT